MTREHIREQVMQIVFQMDVANNFDYTTLSILEENKMVVEKKQAILLLTAIKDHITEIDEVISANTDKWKTGRIAKTELAILRIAVAEMLFIDSIPRSVSINEAVELAKKYGDERSYAFVNAILRRVNDALEA